VTSNWVQLLLNVIALFLAPIIALWVGGILRRRSDAYSAKLSIFSTLIGLRHLPLSAEMFRALNLIDAVFANDPAVREAWTQYLTTLQNESLGTNLVGLAVREDKRHKLLLEIVKALKLNRKISSADLLRTYIPTLVAEDFRLSILERLQKTASLEEELTRRQIPFPPSQLPPQAYPVPPQPSGPAPAGNGAEQPVRSN
jgi:hypothetical protein